MRLDKLLLGHGVITPDEASRAESYMRGRGCKFGEALVALEIMTEPQVEVFLGKQRELGARGIIARSKAVLGMSRAVAQSTAQRSEGMGPLDALRLRLG